MDYNIDFYNFNFSCVSKFKSIRRALKRGHITPNGTIIPRRPFNSRKDTKGRQYNILKKQIYYELTRRGTERKQEDTV